MFRILLTSAAIVIAAPAAFAQDIQGTAPVPAQPADPAQATPSTSSSQVAAIVDSEFPAYDADKSGDLNQAEFSKWILALKAQELKTTGKTLPATELTAWASAAFTTADADRSAAITKGELTHYLGG